MIHTLSKHSLFMSHLLVSEHNECITMFNIRFPWESKRRIIQGALVIDKTFVYSLQKQTINKYVT